MFIATIPLLEKAHETARNSFDSFALSSLVEVAVIVTTVCCNCVQLDLLGIAAWKDCKDSAFPCMWAI